MQVVRSMLEMNIALLCPVSNEVQNDLALLIQSYVYNIINVEGSITNTTATIINRIDCSNTVRRDRELEEQMLTVMVESQSLSRSPLVIPKAVEEITSQIQADLQSTDSELLSEVVRVAGQGLLNITVSAMESPSPSTPENAATLFSSMGICWVLSILSTLTLYLS
jgi:hypothetical protein